MEMNGREQYLETLRGEYRPREQETEKPGC